ncbi:MAG: hypothetical protein HPY62_03125 [Bacteroidales bacterium]|nr:hypothetical protein [Bacteroidales bacterium]
MSVSEKVRILFGFMLAVAMSSAGQVNPDQVAEKVYLHIDRSHYRSGDDIWFKAYVIDPATNLLSLNTNNLHVELISPKPEILMSKIVRIENGTGNGDFHLGESLASGNYLIRAYTNHMRNYDSEFFFRKQIKIVNPADTDFGLITDTVSILSDFKIRYFPEGGSLVENVISKVAFKAEDGSGRSCTLSGSLFSANGDSITSFKTSHSGMGYFMFRPHPGESYYTIVKNSSGEMKKVPLPEVHQTGISLSASFSAPNTLLVTLRTNAKTAASLFEKNLNLTLSSRNVVVRSVKLRISSIVSHFEIPVIEFPPGIIRLTLTDEKGLILSERSIFYYGQRDAHINISTDKKEYQPHEKVRIKLSLLCDSGSVISGNFSLAAVESQFPKPDSLFPSTITSWFLLESEITGPVEKPSYFFNSFNPDSKENLDLLLLTKGWRGYKWKDPGMAFQNENGFVVSGKIREGASPADGVGVTMGIFGKNISDILYTKTDSLGCFRFDNIDITGDNKIVVSSPNATNKTPLNITIDTVIYNPAEIEDETIAYQKHYFNKSKILSNRSESGLNNSGRSKKVRDRTVSEKLNTGILSIQKNDVENPEVTSVSFTMKGFDEPRIFHEQIKKLSWNRSRKTDKHSLVFWEPNIHLKSDTPYFIEFTNSDKPGIIKIIVEGITGEGIPVSGMATYVVKQSRGENP